MKFIPAIIKLIKFGFVGLSGLCIDFGITWLLKEKARINKYVANSCGFISAVVNNYTWNRYWTFKSTHDWLPEFGRFILFALAGLVLSNLLILFFHGKRNVKFYYAKGLAVICVFAWNFLANFFYNF